MRLLVLVCLLSVCMGCRPAAPRIPSGPRFALLVGANTGWLEDVPLRAAVSDAQRLAQALALLGDFPEEQVVLLPNPTADELRQRLVQMATRLQEAREPLFLFYYSGHADPRALHLRGPRPLTLVELDTLLRGVPAALRLAFLDTCHGGAILTRGPPSPPALEYRSADETLLFVTSSGADELAQETRTLAGSLFTHHLVSGLYGAADRNTDGRVSLSEAFAHAAARTLRDSSRGAVQPQQPQASPTADTWGALPLTRLDVPGVASLALPEGATACYLVEESGRQLVAESTGAPLRLALAPGSYQLTCYIPGRGHMLAPFAVEPEEQVSAEALAFSPLPPGEPPVPVRVPRRSQLERLALAALARGELERAQDLFERLLMREPANASAHLGKARALWRKALLARRLGLRAEALRHQSSACLAWPSLDDYLPEQPCRALESADPSPQPPPVSRAP